jgi:hypothetical protein
MVRRGSVCMFLLSRNLLFSVWSKVRDIITNNSQWLVPVGKSVSLEIF